MCSEPVFLRAIFPLGKEWEGESAKVSEIIKTEIMKLSQNFDEEPNIPDCDPVLTGKY